MAGFSPITYAVSKTLLEDSLIGLGITKGSNVEISKIETKNDINYITFHWKSLDVDPSTGDYKDEYQTIEVKNGTPILIFQPNYDYKVGNIVIYKGQFWRCIIDHTSGADMDKNMFMPLQDQDPEYSIWQSYKYRPSIMTPGDIRIAYSVEDYTENGVLYKAGYYVYKNDGAGNWDWYRTMPPVLDRFMEVELPDGTHQLYFDGKRVITEKEQSYLIVDTYADIDTTGTKNVVYMVQNPTYDTTDPTKIIHYSGEYFFDGVTQTIEYMDEKESVNIDFNTEMPPVVAV